MKSQDTSRLLEAHRRLYTVQDMVNVCAIEPRLCLPSMVSVGKSWWLVVAATALLCMLGYAAMFAAWPPLAESRWVMAAWLLGWGLMCIRKIRSRPYRIQWVLDITQRQLFRAGRSAEPISLNTEHSIGCIPGPYSHGAWSCSVELRHKRLGPVATLFDLEVQAALGSSLGQQMAALDHCLDMLARRLDIQRSGGRLTASPRSEAGTSLPSYE